MDFCSKIIHKELKKMNVCLDYDYATKMKFFIHSVILKDVVDIYENDSHDNTEELVRFLKLNDANKFMNNSITFFARLYSLEKSPKNGLNDNQLSYFKDVLIDLLKPSKLNLLKFSVFK